MPLPISKSLYESIASSPRSKWGRAEDKRVRSSSGAFQDKWGDLRRYSQIDGEKTLVNKGGIQRGQCRKETRCSSVETNKMEGGRFSRTALVSWEGNKRNPFSQLSLRASYCREKMIRIASVNQNILC